MTRYLNEKEVSELTSIPLQTLRNQRHRRVGFPYTKLTRAVRYAERDVLDLMESRKILTADCPVLEKRTGR